MTLFWKRYILSDIYLHLIEYFNCKSFFVIKYTAWKVSVFRVILVDQSNSEYRHFLRNVTILAKIQFMTLRFNKTLWQCYSRDILRIGTLVTAREFELQNCCMQKINLFCALRKIPKFDLIFWCENFMVTHSFRDLSETLRKLCLSTKFPHQEITWNIGVLRSGEHWTLLLLI